jgi:hypothetical protein
MTQRIHALRPINGNDTDMTLLLKKNEFRHQISSSKKFLLLGQAALGLMRFNESRFSRIQA